MAEDTGFDIEETEKRELAESGTERTRDRLAFVPRADIYETADAITVVADMPGVNEESLDITLDNNVLTINGYVDIEPPKGYNLAYSEYRVGDYVRAFTLSNQIDRDGIEATLRDGVLRLHLRKFTEAQRRRIPIAGQ